MEQGRNQETFDHQQTFSRLVEGIVARQPLSEHGVQSKRFVIEPNTAIATLANEVTHGNPSAVSVSKVMFAEDIGTDTTPDYQVTFYEYISDDETMRVEYHSMDGELLRTADTTKINPNASKLTRYLDRGRLDTSDDEVVRGLIKSIMQDVHDSGQVEVSPQEDPENFQTLYTLLNELSWEQGAN